MTVFMDWKDLIALWVIFGACCVFLAVWGLANIISWGARLIKWVQRRSIGGAK